MSSWVDYLQSKNVPVATVSFGDKFKISYPYIGPVAQANVSAGTYTVTTPVSWIGDVTVTITEPKSTSQVEGPSVDSGDFPVISFVNPSPKPPTVSGELHANVQEAFRQVPLEYKYVDTISGKLSITYFAGHAGGSYSSISFDPALMWLSSTGAFVIRSVKDFMYSSLRIRYYGALSEFEGEVIADFYLSSDSKVVKVIFKDVKVIFGESNGEVLTLYFDHNSCLNGKIADPSGTVVTLPVGPFIPVEDVTPTEPQEEPTSVIGDEEKEEKKSKWYLWLAIGVIIIVVLFVLGR